MTQQAQPQQQQQQAQQQSQAPVCLYYKLTLIRLNVYSLRLPEFSRLLHKRKLQLRSKILRLQQLGQRIISN